MVSSRKDATDGWLHDFLGHFDYSDRCAWLSNLLIAPVRQIEFAIEKAIHSAITAVISTGEANTAWPSSL